MPVPDVLNDWTRALIDELDAVQLADLERGPTTYRVFLFPEALQFDLSMTPAAQFRPAGPRFRLLFGEAAQERVYRARARVAGGALRRPPCATTRSRLSASSKGLPAVQARGYDDLSAETLARFEATHVGSLEPGALRAALAGSVLALMREGAEAGLPHADIVVQRLAELL